MIKTEEKQEKAILAGVHTGSGDILNDTTDESIAELYELAKTANVETVGICIQNRIAPDSATYVGEGKLEEIRLAACETGATTVIFDDELSPVQIRNIGEALDLKVIDRTMLILDIFAARAITKEGKIQVELAQLKYMMPRLVGYGNSLSRLGGGIGTRGPGETKLETDRRHIRKKISSLSEELKDIASHRELLRSRRKKDGRINVALVGYTNAGKSSLLNYLTEANVLAQDKLFATLDPTIRDLTLSDRRKIALIDTVGFIRKLPHHLIKAFKSTLEEAALADVLIHVIDSSNPEFLNHIQIVCDILDQLGAAGKPTVCVLNKIDLCEDKNFLIKSVPNSTYTVFTSLKTHEGLDDLMRAIENAVPGKKEKVFLLIPYSEGAIVESLHKNQLVISEDYTENGTKICAMIDEICYNKLRNYVVRQ